MFIDFKNISPQNLHYVSS